MANTVTAITVDNGGTGYTVVPEVQIIGGGGGGAIAHANISGGAVSTITVDKAGAGYTSLPTITVRPGSGGLGSGCVAHATLG